MIEVGNVSQIKKLGNAIIVVENLGKMEVAAW